MTEQERELNKRLLRFCGFRPRLEADDGSIWWYPDGEWHYHLSDLVHDLSAQAKWLLPKFWEFNLTKGTKGYAAVVGVEGSTTVGSASDADAATAIAQAAEKAIGVGDDS